MNWILHILLHKKKKLTQTRKKIATFIENNCSFCAQDILKNIPKLDKVSVYRTIDLFSELDIIHPTRTHKGHQYYETHGPNHHHHEQCEHCGSATCVTCPLETKNTHDHHTLFFTKKTCQNCSL